MATPAVDVADANTKPELTDEEKKAAKRKEIEEKLAELKLQKEKEEAQKTRFFGEHPGITCDGCGVGPIVGYRYHCKSCPNHDVCENCFDASKRGGGEFNRRVAPEDCHGKLERSRTHLDIVRGKG